MVELAEDEMRNFGKVWALVIVSLSFIIWKIIPTGFRRLVAVLPIISLFIALPLNLTSIHLCGFTAFLITWPSKSISSQSLACPSKSKPPQSQKMAQTLIKNHRRNPTHLVETCKNPKTTKTHIRKHQVSHAYLLNIQKNPSEKSLWNYIVKAIIVALFLQIYDHSQQIPQVILWIIYFLLLFFVLEILSASLAKLATFFLGLQLEHQFNEPLSISLQDFWGRRWNLMVTSIMRPTVFQPIRDLTLRPLGPQLATYLVVMAAFVVSAVMHELMLFYLSRVRPTFEVTWFFLLHGVCVCLKVTVKVYVGKRWRVPWWISCPATLGGWWPLGAGCSCHHCLGPG